MTQSAAVRQLDELIDFYFRGHEHPLPFFPKASLAAHPYEGENWINTAKTSFCNWNNSGDWADPDVQKVFQLDDFDNPDFTREFAEVGKAFFQFYSDGGMTND